MWFRDGKTDLSPGTKWLISGTGFIHTYTPIHKPIHTWMNMPLKIAEVFAYWVSVKSWLIFAQSDKCGLLPRVCLIKMVYCVALVFKQKQGCMVTEQTRHWNADFRQLQIVLLTKCYQIINHIPEKRRIIIVTTQKQNISVGDGLLTWAGCLSASLFLRLIPTLGCWLKCVKYYETSVCI